MTKLLAKLCDKTIKHHILISFVVNARKILTHQGNRQSLKGSKMDMFLHVIELTFSFLSLYLLCTRPTSSIQLLLHMALVFCITTYGTCFFGFFFNFNLSFYLMFNLTHPFLTHHLPAPTN